jgi:membrane protease YdiL (CAAX protease family)
MMGTPVDGSSTAVSDRRDWIRLALGLIAVYGLFQWSAAKLGSDRGQAGLVVAAIVVTATVLVESLRSRQTITSTLHALGLGPPHVQGLAIATGVCFLLLLVVPAFSMATGAAVTTMDRWWLLVPGLFAQAGIAEETLFRGYLFGRLRTGRTFWRAATLSMVPFVAVHLLLFFTMPFWVAMAALLLAVVTSFPMAQLFELGGGTIWPPALLHFVIQGTIMVLVLSGEASAAFPLVWMMASAVLPLIVFLVPRPRSMGSTSAAP